MIYLNKIICFYNIKFNTNMPLKLLRKSAEKIIATKLCRCIKNLGIPVLFIRMVMYNQFWTVVSKHPVFFDFSGPGKSLFRSLLGCCSPGDPENRIRGAILHILVVGELRGMIFKLFYDLSSDTEISVKTIIQKRSYNQNGSRCP